MSVHELPQSSHLFNPASFEGFTAVPLELNLDDAERYRAYRDRSLRVLGQRATEAMTDMRQVEWVGSTEIAHGLHELISNSIIASQMHRIERSGSVSLDGIVGLADERLAAAREGVATPDQLLTLLIDYPKIGSIELAKLSHPLDFAATGEMDTAIAALLEQLAVEYTDELPHYKRKSINETLPAMVMLRKQAIARYPTDEGRLIVKRRQALLLRGDEEVTDNLDPILDRKIRQTDRHQELAAKVEGYLANIHKHPHLQWLQPIATSYYAYIERADPQL